jgi:ankyrin repeat protein
MSGKTPIQAACEGGHTEAVQVLLKANAKKPELVSGDLFSGRFNMMQPTFLGYNMTSM